MDTLLDDDQTLIRDSVRDFFRSEAGPQRVRAAVTAPGRIDRALWREFCGLGWSGLCLSPEAGGQGLPLVCLGLLFEEIGRHIAPIPALGSLTTALLLDRTRSAHGMADRAAGIAGGELIAALAFADLGQGGARSGCGTLTGRREGADVVLDGAVRYVDGGLGADCYLASFVLTEADGTSAPALALVEGGAAGLGVVPLVTTAKDAQADLRFDGVRVVADHMLATGETAAAMIAATTDLATVLTVALMAGGARRALEFAADYAKERKAFGHPIGSFQAIQHLAADMLNAVDGASLLAREALWRMDNGLDAGLEVSQAKAFASERCVMVCRSAQQIHGGIGFMEEFDLHLWYRPVLAWSLRWGTAAQHRERVAAAILDRADFPRLDSRVDAQPPQTGAAVTLYALAAGLQDEDPALAAASG